MDTPLCLVLQNRQPISLNSSAISSPLFMKDFNRRVLHLLTIKMAVLAKDGTLPRQSGDVRDPVSSEDLRAVAF